MYIQQKDKVMKDFPILFVKLQEYALISHIGRRIENLHARVKRTGAHRYGISVPQLCAELREHQHLKALHDDPEFKNFCTTHWHSRNLLDQLLVLRVDKEKLKSIDTKTKIQMVYQCSLDCEYDSAVASRVGQRDFR